MRVCIYSVNQPDIKTDKYLCLSTDIKKIYEANYYNIVDWIIDWQDTNALEFMDKMLKYRIHPHSRWGIYVPDLKVETQQQIPYSYQFLEVC